MIGMKASRRDITAPFCVAELLGTMQPDPSGQHWGNTTYPLAGDEIVTQRGELGYVMRTCPGRPTLPEGGMHRYVQIDGEPTIAWHISRLRPFGIATEIN